MDTGQKTESISQLCVDIERGRVVLPEFQRDFVWEVQKSYDLFDSFVKDIFTGSLIYGVPSFEITARELDDRPRTGKGSRRKLTLTNYSHSDIERLVKTEGFRLLLDGQQRATSIYRAAKGIDPIYLVLYPESELELAAQYESVGKRSLEASTKEIRGEPLEGHVCVKISDVYAMLNGEMPRERDKLKPFLESSPLAFASEEEAMNSAEFNSYLSQSKNLENLLRQEKLVAYYLLDTDEEKFALFFERSNSKGIQLNFIDILAAKLYVGFNLRSEIERFEEAYPALPLNREAVVRAISFIVSGGKDTGRSYILAKLTYAHFDAHWIEMTTAYRKVYDYLYQNRMLIHHAWMPYESITIPLMVLLNQLKGKDFGEMSKMQTRIVQSWYWSSVFARRFSSAAQTFILEDAQHLERVGAGEIDQVSTWLQKIQPVVRSADDLLGVSKQYDAIYKGVLNLVHFASGGLINWMNGDRLSVESSLEDHHIFPKDYLRKRKNEGADDTLELTDCIANRTLIPKLQNIRISNKAPSQYLAEVATRNPKLTSALNAHLIPIHLLDGDYDDVFDLFLYDRAKEIFDVLQHRVILAKEELVRDLEQISGQANSKV